MGHLRNPPRNIWRATRREPFNTFDGRKGRIHVEYD
jgi:hypothetical protein